MPRLLTEYQDHAIRKRHTEFLVVVEPGSHFQNIHVVVPDVAILDMDIARRLLEIQESDWRDNNLVFRIENKAVFDRLEQLRNIDECLISSSFSTLGI